MHTGTAQQPLAVSPKRPAVQNDVDTSTLPTQPTPSGQPAAIATTVPDSANDMQPASAAREIIRPNDDAFRTLPNAGIFVDPGQPPKNPTVADVANELSGSIGVENPGTRLLATVGTQSILLGDVLGQINEMLLPYKGGMSDADLERQRDELVRQILPQVVERKLLFNDFLAKIPPERLPEIERSVYEHFTDNRLPEMLKRSGLKDDRELDAKLRSLGSSLSNQQRMFFEQMVSFEAVKREVADDKDISHQELLDYYHQHLADYEFAAQVRWEQLVVEKSRMESPAKAYNTLGEWGNQVLRGADFATIAKQHSHGPRGFAGGQYDWTTQGSLVAKEIDRVLFLMPPGKLSRIIDNGDTYHIVRVIERKAAGREPFTTVQAGIKKTIEQQRREDQLAKYIDRLEADTAVWINPQYETLAPAN